MHELTPPTLEVTATRWVHVSDGVDETVPAHVAALKFPVTANIAASTEPAGGAKDAVVIEVAVALYTAAGDDPSIVSVPPEARISIAQAP